MVSMSDDERQTVEVANYYLKLLGDELKQRTNIAALAMVIGWQMGKRKKEQGAKDTVETGFTLSGDGMLLGQMIGASAALAMECKTLEEAFLE